MALMQINRSTLIEPVADTQGLTSLLLSLSHSLLSWRDRYATQKALARLSNRELEDIGLTRDLISQVR